MRLTLALIAALLLSIAANGWQLYHAGGAEPKCQVALDKQENNQSTSTQQDQHTADTQRIDQLQKQQPKINQDNASDAGEFAALKLRVNTQEKALDEYRKKQPDICLATAVPDALLDSLRTGAGGAAQPSGGRDPLRR